MIFDSLVERGASGIRWRDAERSPMWRDLGTGGNRSFEENLALFERQVLSESQHQAHGADPVVNSTDALET